MNAREKDLEGAPGRGAYPRMRMVVFVMKWTGFTALGLFALAVILALGGTRLPFWFPSTEVTQEKPYSDFVGREYRVTGPVTALAWNDFPDKIKILSISLTRPPGTRNRFVSYSVPLQLGQRVRIIRAWRQFTLAEFTYHYVVSVPGAGLPDGIPITMTVNSDGVPDPLVYEAIGKAGG